MTRACPPAAAMRRACASACSAASFNPAHQGHRLVSLTALRRLGLDRVWWMVTPGNPLKDNGGLPPAGRAHRGGAARSPHHPRIDVTGFEAAIGTRLHLRHAALPGAALPGRALRLAHGRRQPREFHRWQRWREIAHLAPIAVVDRPGSTLRACRTPRRRGAGAVPRSDESDAPAACRISRRRPGSSCTGRVRLSSTALRAGCRKLADALRLSVRLRPAAGCRRGHGIPRSFQLTSDAPHAGRMT